jgi:AsmA family protein
VKLPIFPVPGLNVKDVSFANAGWGSRSEMAKLGELSARVEALPLIFDDNLHILMDTSDVSMLGEGTVNLGSEGLDLELIPRPKETSLLDLAVPIDIGGTFKHPTVEPNRLAMAKQVAVGVVGAFNPLIIIGALVLNNSGGSEKNPCVAAFEGGKGSAAEKDEGGVSGAVNDLGRSIESIFN